jgi:hypothetical protein
VKLFLIDIMTQRSVIALKQHLSMAQALKK